MAARSRDLLTPSCSSACLENAPLLLGSGKFGTPWARTHRAKASTCETNADGALGAPVADGLPPEPVDELPPHAASRARPTVAMMMATAVRAAGRMDGRRMHARLSEIFAREIKLHDAQEHEQKDIGPRFGLARDRFDGFCGDGSVTDSRPKCHP